MFAKSVLVASILGLAAFTASAQQAPPPYGMPITLDVAKKVMVAAEAEAVKNNWPVAIAILDSGGNIVMLHRLDNAQLAANDLSVGKARTALSFRRPSKALEDAVAGGGAGLRLLALNITPIEGGFPIIIDGKIVGAVGVAGGLGAQDAQVAKTGVDAAK